MRVNRKQVLAVFAVGIFALFLVARSRPPSRYFSANILGDSVGKQEEIFHQHYPFSPNVTRGFRYENTDLDKAFYEFPIPKDALYVYKAFYDLRDPEGPRIRVCVTASCRVIDDPATTIDLRVDGQSIGLGWKNSTNCCKCAVDGCKYFSYDIASKIYRGPVPETVSFHRNEHSAEIPVEQPPSKYTDDISACTGPLHWYNDWPRLILYVETARLNGISRILVTWQSISKEVKAVIDYYQQKGIIHPLPWPALPFNDEIDVYPQVHNAGQNLFNQYCNFWSSSKYTHLSDVDELLHIRHQNRTLYDLLEATARENASIGGFRFQHTPLALNWIPEPFDYEKFLKLDALRSARTPNTDRWRLGKSIWMTNVTRISWVHYVLKFFAGRENYHVPREQALLLHMRNSFQKSTAAPLFPNFQLWPKEQMDERLAKMADTIREIFRDGPPNYRTSTLPASEKCTRVWPSCWNAGASCFTSMSNHDDWIYATPTPQSFHIPV
ncbi:unnamed protein product, partial [Mesorhabditis spiculigera]